ncbi:NifB/NifX family molybdenum-iron cluster-binding protein [bacterium]|nr:NifB/NifX family molybdenum-iron cluster-binding protein [bacterium]
MKICMPTSDRRGLEAATYGHVGGAPYYTIVDTETGDLRTVGRGDHEHRGDECGPGTRIRSLDVDTVVCSDIGRHAMACLGAAGISVLVSDAGTVEQVLAAARRGDLRPLSPDEACAGHGARHGSHGSCGKHGRSHRHHRERPEGVEP